MVSKFVNSLNSNCKEHLTQIEHEAKKLKLLHEKSYNLPDTFKDTMALQASLQQERNELKQSLLELLQKDRDLQMQSESLQSEIENLARIVDKGQEEVFEDAFAILGYRVHESRSLGNSEMEWTLQYMDTDCCIKFLVGDTYELLDIQPEHQNLSGIKMYLQQTQDIGGMLDVARKYFIIMGYIHNMENNSNN